jgi:hypothetical protein
VKIGEVLRTNQNDVYKKLCTHKKHKRRGDKSKKDGKLTFSDVEKLMRHDSHTRGHGGDKKWN